ncbi:FGFR1 oncogene partner-like [Dendronephthya gigantea]|uniref:FGFR1 oncogene partner-like n=1 Tax=Dendronephthya gigantea TaxID=151771 RepID=UPI00106B52E9|nr:FGFR1 oncogene partner-like [Dendronephthya gigantea]
MNISAEEDPDLRDLVAHTLENNGVLGRIKAELRANVFMVLDAHDKNEMNQLPFVNEKLKNFINTKEGRLVTGLVKEFLEFFGLEYSLAVFDPETGFGDRYQGREGLAEDLNLSNVVNSSKPVISSLLENNLQPAMPKLDLGSITEDILKKGRVSPEISPRSVSSGSRNSSPRMSRIPQRVKEKKKTEKLDKSETKTPKDSDKSLDEELKSGGLKTGNSRNSDLSVSLNDDDILAEFTKPRLTSSKDKASTDGKKGFLLDESTTRPSFEESWLHTGKSSLPSLKDRSLLSGSKDLAVSSGSADFKELEEIDRRINELGFGVPAEDKASSQGDDYNDSYADDFHPSTHSNNSSIPEEIDLGSFKSDHSKTDDLVTSDRTISPEPVDFKDLDYSENVNF